MIRIAAQGVTIVISPGEEKTAIMRVFAYLQQMEDYFHDDPGFDSNATGLTHLEEAIVRFN